MAETADLISWLLMIATSVKSPAAKLDLDVLCNQQLGK
jgi:hypothetical protein